MNQINDELWKLYEQAFPPEERRSKEAQKQILKLSNYFVRPYYEGNSLMGFICFWLLKQCMFIEHLAVDEALRGKGYGKKIVAETIKAAEGMVILEVEYPDNTIAERRIKFYEGLGFVCNDLEYQQPSLGEGKAAIPLILMSFPHKIPTSQTDSLIGEIYSTVYQVKSNK
ncbi:GNAT family N-acetyltransferase [Alkaliphilus crotonatoxidans]